MLGASNSQQTAGFDISDEIWLAARIEVPRLQPGNLGRLYMTNKSVVVMQAQINVGKTRHLVYIDEPKRGTVMPFTVTTSLVEIGDAIVIPKTDSV